MGSVSDHACDTDFADRLYVDNQHKVLQAAFKYFAVLRTEHFEAWRQSERCKIAQLNFRFQERYSPAGMVRWLSGLAAWHRSRPIPRENFVKYITLVDDWDNTVEANEILHALLNGMTLENGRIIISAKREDHERLRGTLQWTTEPIFGTLYTVEPLDAELVHEVLQMLDILFRVCADSLSDVGSRCT